MAEQSRNSWIKKDDPKLVSARCKDGYEDVLADIRGTYDTKIFTRKRNPPRYKYNHPRTPAQIKAGVVKSDRVQYAIDEVTKTSDVPRSEVEKEAQSIVDEMAHNMNMTKAKSLAFVLAKVFKSLFGRIYVNMDGVTRTRQLSEEYPVLLLPTHRSYLDFLIVSYLCFEYDMPTPCIASAMDFLNMRLMGSLLRNCGAFFIRRTFGSDQLYWAVFTEYVQTQIHNGDHPVEFYVEGTRSRTSKSYYPRIGMLSATLEPYFKAHVPDVMIVPISISYDRVVEETLYSYELLGVPKPKESTSGLIKARKVLSEDFGSIHVHYAQPISIRQFSTGRIDRISHSLCPRYIASVTPEETQLIQTLALHVVRTHQSHLMISPWSLMATVLMQSLETGVYVGQLVKEVEWVKSQACNLGAQIDWPGNESADTVIKAHLRLHGNIVTVNEHEIVSLLPVTVPVTSKTDEGHKTDKLMEEAAQHLLLAMYRNQVTHVFVNVAMVALVVSTWPHDTITLAELYTRYKLLESLMGHDFIFHPEESQSDFDKSVACLTHTCSLSLHEGVIDVKKSVNKYTTFFSRMFEPFLLAYWVLAQYMLSMANDIHNKPQAKPSKVIVKEAQMLAAMLLRDQTVRHYEILSLDVLNNGLLSLVDMGAIIKEKRDGINYLFANAIVLSKVSEDIDKLIEVPALQNTRINLNQKTVTINSKL